MSAQRPTLRTILASPRFVWLIVALALLLGLPTLGLPLFGDDVQQYAFLHAQHSGASEPWWEMFSLVEGPADKTIGLRTAGRYPWWTDPELRIVFFRPLTVLTHHVDHWLWPDAIWAMHLQSVVWHALVAGLAWALARRLASSEVAAALAALVFVLAYAHVIPVAWLAQRNALVSTAWGLACVLAHDRWRSKGSRLAGILAPLALAGSLLSAEAGVATFGLLLAYALALDEGTAGRRALSLLPSVVVIVVWRLVYDAMGYGAIGSGAYLDPIGDPLGFVEQLPQRFGWLMAYGVSPPAFPGAPQVPWWALTAVLAAVLLTFVVTTPARAARFGCLAALLGSVPLAASIPSDRLLTLTGFGFALACGELLDRWLLASTTTRPRQAAAGLVAFVHLIVSPIAAWMFVTRLGEIEYAEGVAAFFGPELPNEGLERRGLVIVHAPNYLSASRLPDVRAALGLARPNFQWLLHAGDEAPTIRKLDERTIELATAEGWPPPLAELWRSATRSPFAVGDTVKTVDFVATVREVDGGRATRVEFRFRAPLDHPSFVWAHWGGAEFEVLDLAALPE